MHGLKFISSNNILGRVYRDYNINGGGWEEDAIEWIGQALDAIGTVDTTTLLGKKYTVKNNKILLPCAAEAILGIEYNKSWLCWTNYSPVKTEVEKTQYPLYQGIEKCSLQVPYVIFNFTDKEITLWYYIRPVDEKGYPMILDNEPVKAALAAYIMERLLLRGYKHPVIDYPYAKSEWIKLRDQATNHNLMPSPLEIGDTLDGFRSPASQSFDTTF